MRLSCRECWGTDLSERYRGTDIMTKNTKEEKWDYSIFNDKVYWQQIFSWCFICKSIFDKGDTIGSDHVYTKGTS